MDVRCPNCGTSFEIGNGNVTVNPADKAGIGYLVPKTVRNENVKKSKKEERIEKLKAAGFDVDKFASMFANNADEILNSCFDDSVCCGVKTDLQVNKLFRRWVMAQTFRMLKYDWNLYVQKELSYTYTMRQLLDEIRMLGKLQKKDFEAFRKRERFFNKNVILKIIRHHKTQLYKFVADSNSYKFDRIEHMLIWENYVNYDKLYNLIKELPDAHYRNKKSKDWIDAYKGAGAYYTLENMIRYHGCILYSDEGSWVGDEAISHLENFADRFATRGEGYKLHAILKLTIEKNNFDFYKVMKKKYRK